MQGENADFLSDFALRLNSRAEHLGLSQADVAARLNVKPPRVNHWFQGNNFPRSRERAELAKLLGCSADWLFHGAGSPEEKTEELSDAGGNPVRSLPLISWTHAGAAATYEEMPRHFQGRISSMSRDKRAFALIIEGDSMEPKFLPGDRVVLEPGHAPVNGKPVVAKFIDDAVQLRVYHKMPSGAIRLAPLNPVYPTLEHAPAAFAWIFPVAELIRPI